jgi:uncharacterized protein (DUF58 family)
VNWLTTRLLPGQSVRLSEETNRSRRCRYVCQPLRAVSGYPFGLVQRSAVIGPEEELIVLPQLGQLHRGKLRHFLGQAVPAAGWQLRCPRPQPLVPTEFHGIRPFQRGDSPRWIHWRTSARRGELMVREFEETTNDNLLLVVEPWVPAEEPGADRVLEESISLAATIVWEWCRQKDDRFTLAVAGPAPTVLTGITGRDHARRMLECLAVLGGSPDSSWDKLRDLLIPARLPAGPVLVISTRPSELTATLALHLQRPVAELNAAELDRYDFYERPESHAA